MTSRIQTMHRGVAAAGVSTWSMLALVALLSATATSGLATVDVPQWAEGQSNKDGATRKFYNRSAQAKWARRMGDWTDAADVMYGSEPFASTTVPSAGTDVVELDVTELVEHWLDGDFPNQGLMLRKDAGGGVLGFVSKDAGDASRAPRLVIDSSAGHEELEPEADTFLTSSTYKSMGAGSGLKLGDESPILMRFDLAGTGQIDKAILRLHINESWGPDRLQIGVYRVVPGGTRSASSQASLRGLAETAQGRLSDHPQVLYVEDFETDDWTDRLRGKFREGNRLVDPGHGGSLPRHVGKALAVTIPEGGKGGLNLRYRFEDNHGAEPEAMYFRYYLMFAPDWKASQGGKLPGFAGTYGVAGWGGRRAKGDDGWSARGRYWLTPPPGNPLEGLVPVGSYVYHVDAESHYGEPIPWRENGGGYLEKGRWYSVEQYLRLNSPGASDGVLKAWIDGIPVLERDGLRFRTTDALRIQEIWLNVFHGGMEPAPRDLTLYIDDLVIARRYIGPREDQATAE